MRKKLAALFIMFAIVISGSFAISQLFRENSKHDETNKINIVTSFYPMYIIALNLTDGAEGVSISNLTPNQTGCLHDYQFSTSDMKKLSGTDAFIINGGGMENFIMEVVSNYPDIDIIDSSEGIPFLSEGDDHDDSSDDDGDNHDEEHGEYNAHAWMNPNYYIRQINNVRDGLSGLDPAHSDIYKKNAANYISKIDKLIDEINDLKTDNFSEVLIFHDAFAYLAAELGLDVAASVEIDSDNNALSAGEIADIINDMKKNNIRYIFIEKQYSSTIADAIAEATDATIYSLDSIVTGDDDKDAYINAMHDNLDIIREISVSTSS